MRLPEVRIKRCRRTSKEALSLEDVYRHECRLRWALALLPYFRAMLGWIAAMELVPRIIDLLSML
ncbi:MAG TPA: hypothetical protein VHM02_10615 [Thermoanaerobaculia bacterium]|nr:hypothetical protein [Thermoanaerobaculia bacterium]